MDERAAAIGLARLGGILRAEAANGLFWGAADDELARLRRLRSHAASLIALVDHRPPTLIESIFESDTGLRTPMPATELRVHCADGRTLVRRSRLRRGRESLGERLRSTAETLGAATPDRAGAIGDTDEAGLPCPQTFLLVYDIDTDLDADGAERRLAPGDPDLDGPIEAVAPSRSAETGGRGPLPVSHTAATILEQVAGLWTREGADTADFYERERRERVEALCADVDTADLDYPRIDCGDLAAEGPAVGADTAIFDDRERLLLIRRTDTGQWAMPGGAAEVGEPVGAAAVREAFEETGLDVRLTGLIWAFDKRDTDYADSRMPMILSYAAEASDPAQPVRLAELEASDHRWIGRDQIDRVDFFRGHELRVPAAFASRRQ